MPPKRNPAINPRTIPKTAFMANSIRKGTERDHWGVADGQIHSVFMHADALRLKHLGSASP
jgi:hypothetical protein